MQHSMEPVDFTSISLAAGMLVLNAANAWMGVFLDAPPSSVIQWLVFFSAATGLAWNCIRFNDWRKEKGWTMTKAINWLLKKTALFITRIKPKKPTNDPS